ncbi:lipid A biosynthesis acyltransferase [Comamonadaceae bacterium G21597-S1]|nr:lipid A biosynthesis acyltransferase [Comamonadaceae bacterium G21597-S1]
MLSRLGIGFMRLMALLPLRGVRALGRVLGWFLYLLAASRRRVVAVNLRLCFPHLSDAEREATARRTFVYFAQAWLDRGWLWHGGIDRLEHRLRLRGAVHELQGDAPTVVFAPHFVGLDAGWTALTRKLPRAFTTIYSNQVDPLLDRWILDGRKRFGRPRLFGRDDGLKPVVQALRAGQPLYLLPDMNITRQESVFVPFFGVSTATLTSLSRFAKMGRAKVVPVITELTDAGYDVHVLPAWEDFPTDNLQADAATMNRRLQDYVERMPSQYYWVHKRFKMRPAGETSVY